MKRTSKKYHIRQADTNCNHDFYLHGTQKHMDKPSMN